MPYRAGGTSPGAKEQGDSPHVKMGPNPEDTNVGKMPPRGERLCDGAGFSFSERDLCSYLVIGLFEVRFGILGGE